MISCQHTEISSLVPYSDQLRTRYQNYLLTDSYEVLSVDDFNAYPLESSAVKFENVNRELPVWVCTKTNNINFICNDKNYSEQNSTADDNFDSSFSFVQDGIFYEFITRRGFPIESCRQLVNEWKSLAKNQNNICAAGEPLDETKNSSGSLNRTLVYQMIKTKNNCLSWFEGICSKSKR